MHKPVRALISWFSKTVLLCVTIIAALTHTGAQVGPLSATEEFGDCFGGPVEDINLWGMIQKNEFVLIITLILIGMAAYSLERMAERLLTIAIGRRQSLDYQRRVGLALFHRRFEEAATLSAEYPKSPIALAVHAFVRSNTRAVSPDSNPIIEQLFNQRTTDPANTPSACYITQKLNKNSTQRITR